MNYMKKIFIKIKNNPIYIILFLTILSSIPILISLGNYACHDLVFHFTRIKLIKDEILMGNIFSKMYHNALYGFGYGSALFYPDIFLYIPAITSCLGVSLANSYKIFVILINFFSILSIFYSVNNMTKNKNMGYVASIIYALASYRLVDVYIRCAIGEALTFIFVPLIIYGLYIIMYEDYKKIHVLILSMTGIVYSHLISAFIMFFIISIICVINYKHFLREKKRILYLLLSAIITVLLCCFFVLPLLEQLIDRDFYIYPNDYLGTLSDNAVPLYKTILEIDIKDNSTKWSPFGIGIIFAYIMYLKIKNFTKENINSYENKLFIIGVILLLMSTKLFPWSIFNETILSIQFPWRLYTFVTVLLTIVGSVVLVNRFGENMKLLMISLVIINLLPLAQCCYQYFIYPEISSNQFKYELKTIGENDYLPEEINPEELSYIVGKKYNLDVKDGKDFLIINYNKENNPNKYIEVPYIYYLGYTAEYDNQELEIFKTNNGLVGIKTNNIDNGEIKVYYKNTKITNISLILTFIGIIILVGYKLKIYKDNVDKNSL